MESLSGAILYVNTMKGESVYNTDSPIKSFLYFLKYLCAE